MSEHAGTARATKEVAETSTTTQSEDEIRRQAHLARRGVPSVISIDSHKECVRTRGDRRRCLAPGCQAHGKKQTIAKLGACPSGPPPHTPPSLLRRKIRNPIARPYACSW